MVDYIMGFIVGAIATAAFFLLAVVEPPTESTSCPVEPTGKLQTLEEVWYYWELSTNEFVGAAPKVWMSEHGVIIDKTGVKLPWNELLSAPH